LRAGLTWWIGYYNARRPHSTLAGRTPDDAYWASGMEELAAWRQPEPSLSKPPNCPTRGVHLRITVLIAMAIGHSDPLRIAISRRLAHLVIPKKIRRRLGELLWSGKTCRSPDRLYLRERLLPWIARRGGCVLLVGCRRYTARDPMYLQQQGIRCWTLDIDPATSRWGAPGRHAVGAIEQAYSMFPPETFDTVVLSGVFGFGLDSVPEQDASIAACAAILKPEGILVLGWNTDRVSDPEMLPKLAECFRRHHDAELPDRIMFKHSTHVFDMYRRLG